MAKSKGTTAWNKRQAEIAKAKASKDMDLYSVFEVGTDNQIYVGDGIAQGEAQRLNDGLVTPGEVRLVKAADTD